MISVVRGVVWQREKYEGISQSQWLLLPTAVLRQYVSMIAPSSCRWGNITCYGGSNSIAWHVSHDTFVVGSVFQLQLTVWY